MTFELWVKEAKAYFFDKSLHEIRRWLDAKRLNVSGIGVETVLQVSACPLRLWNFG